MAEEGWRREAGQSPDSRPGQDNPELPVECLGHAGKSPLRDSGSLVGVGGHPSSQREVFASFGHFLQLPLQYCQVSLFFFRQPTEHRLAA